jgi:hypothetical protein
LFTWYLSGRDIIITLNIQNYRLDAREYKIVSVIGHVRPPRAWGLLHCSVPQFLRNKEKNKEEAVEHRVGEKQRESGKLGETKREKQERKKEKRKHK